MCDLHQVKNKFYWLEFYTNLAEWVGGDFVKLYQALVELTELVTSSLSYLHLLTLTLLTYFLKFNHPWREGGREGELKEQVMEGTLDRTTNTS